jgi:trans-aconitate methyltransferase
MNEVVNASVAGPARVDYREWSRRWDVQQSFLVVRREERFRVMFDVAQEVLGRAPTRILDLACGTGDVARRALERFPDVHVVGLDADPLLLAIARGALGDASGRASWVRADLRDRSWPAALEELGAFDLVLSSTALHWLPTPALVSVYHATHALLVPGGLLANADVIPPSGGERLARAADALRSRAARQAQSESSGERYAEWWDAVARDPGLADVYRERARLFEDHPEELDLPNAQQHLASLRDGGFAEAGVMWRFFDYAVVVGIKAG